MTCSTTCASGSLPDASKAHLICLLLLLSARYGQRLAQLTR